MYPSRLKPGDQIRVVAPSRSMSLLKTEQIEQAKMVLERLGFHVSFSAHAEEIDAFASSSIESRVNDLHEAFSDPEVKAILSVLGGYNSNQLLTHLDYRADQVQPKIFCGFSDMTALASAIYQKTGLVTYSGPHFSSFSMKQGLNYTKDYFLKCICSDSPFEIEPSEWRCDEIWTKEQPQLNDGPIVINEGAADGKILGGN